jgi:ribosome biogenesis SPOUT family RNA methylase Rps3
MTSDTAMRVVKKIVVDGVPFDQIDFIDRPEIDISANEKLVINFRFLAGDDGLPTMAPGIRDILTRGDPDFDLQNLE